MIVVFVRGYAIYFATAIPFAVSFLPAEKVHSRKTRQKKKSRLKYLKSLIYKQTSQKLLGMFANLHWSVTLDLIPYLINMSVKL